jgi:hypothetical protein
MMIQVENVDRHQIIPAISPLFWHRKTRRPGKLQKVRIMLAFALEFVRALMQAEGPPGCFVRLRPV